MTHPATWFRSRAIAATIALIVASLLSPASTLAVGERLVFTTQPGSGTGGTTFSPQPIVQMQDSNGAIVSNSTDTVTLTLASTSGAPVVVGIGELTGTGCARVPATPDGLSFNKDSANSACTVALSGGVANFSGLAVDKIGAYTLLATTSASGVISGTSAAFTVRAGVGSQLKAKTSSAGAPKGRVIQAQPTIELADAGTNPIEDDNTHTVTLQLIDACTSNPPTNGAALNGTTSLTMSKGRASFTNVSISLSGDYVIRASSSYPAPAVDLGSMATGGSCAGAKPIFVRDQGFSITAAPTGGKVGQPLDPLTIQLVDSSGSVQNTNATVRVHLQINGIDRLVTVGQGGTPCTISGSACYLSQTLINGSVTVAGLVIPSLSSGGAGAGKYAILVELDPASTAGGFTQAAVNGVGNVAPAATASFSVSDRQLFFTSQPGSANAGSPLSRNPVVALADAAGNTVAGNNTDSATIAITGATTAKLSGTGCAADGRTCTLTFANGAAVFSGLAVDTPGTYSLTATTTATDSAGPANLSATSASFTITAAVGPTPTTAPPIPTSAPPPPTAIPPPLPETAPPPEEAPPTVEEIPAEEAPSEAAPAEEQPPAAEEAPAEEEPQPEEASGDETTALAPPREAPPNSEAP